MICLGCDNSEPACFHPEIRPIEQVFNGIILTIDTTMMVCDHCGYAMVTLEQADVLVKKTRDAYELWRSRLGSLPRQIVSKRTNQAMKPKPQKCPWCGSSAIDFPLPCISRYRVCCRNHKCAHGLGPLKRTSAKAIQAWNRITLKGK